MQGLCKNMLLVLAASTMTQYYGSGNQQSIFEGLEINGRRSNLFELTTTEGNADPVSAKVIVSGKYITPLTVDSLTLNGNLAVDKEKNITFTLGKNLYWSGDAPFNLVAKDSRGATQKQLLTVHVQPIGFFGGLWKSLFNPVWGLNKFLSVVGFPQG